MAHPGTTAADVAIACYGLAFKADIDDLRGSPALEIAEKLARAHPGPLIIVEPNIEALPESLSGAQLVDATTAGADGDIHVLLVDHSAFKGRDAPHGVRIDTRGMNW